MAMQFSTPRLVNRPLDRLHHADRTADHRAQSFDAEMIEQQSL